MTAAVPPTIDPYSSSARIEHRMNQQVNEEVKKKQGSITGLWVLGTIAALVAAVILGFALLGVVRTVPQVIFGLVVAVIAVVLHVMNRRGPKAL